MLSWFSIREFYAFCVFSLFLGCCSYVLKIFNKYHLSVFVFPSCAGSDSVSIPRFTKHSWIAFSALRGAYKHVQVNIISLNRHVQPLDNRFLLLLHSSKMKKCSQDCEALLILKCIGLQKKNVRRRLFKSKDIFSTTSNLNR